MLEEIRGETATSYSTLSEIIPAYATHTLRIRFAYAAHMGQGDELLNFIGLGGMGGALSPLERMRCMRSVCIAYAWSMRSVCVAVCVAYA